MHLVTGFLIAALMGGKKKDSRSPLLRMKDPVRTSHLLPGRVRFHISELIGRREQVEQIPAELEKIKGVTRAQASAVTGTVVLNYDPGQLTPELLCVALIRLLDLDDTPRPRIGREVRVMGSSLNRAVYDATGGLLDLWTAIPIVLVLIGLRKMLMEKGTALPTGFTLVWWAYSALFRSHPE